MRALRSVYVYCVCCIGAWPGRCSCLSSGVSVCVCRSIRMMMMRVHELLRTWWSSVSLSRRPVEVCRIVAEHGLVPAHV